MSVRLLEPAQAELDEAIAWYVEQSPGLGAAFRTALSTRKTDRICWFWLLRTSIANLAIGAAG
jgi:hypothetical protein